MIGSTLSRLGCVLIGHVYPVYRTFKATTYKIQADDDQDLSEPCALDYAQLNDLRRILSYWAVMGIFTFAEFFLDIFMSWFPFFFETKIIFLLWLVHSNFSGATFVYDNFIDEVFRHHEVDIDHSLAVCKSQAKSTAAKSAGALAAFLATSMAMALSKSQDMMLEKLSGQSQEKKSRDNGFRFEELDDGQDQENGTAFDNARSKPQTSRARRGKDE